MKRLSQSSIVFRVEQSRSRSKKHILFSTLYIYKKGAGLIPFKKFPHTREVIRPIYSRGEAEIVSVDVDPGDFLIYVWLVKNFKGKVKGYIAIHNHRGELLYKVKYNDGYVTRSKGSPVFAWLIRFFLQATKIPFKELRLGDER